MINKRRVFNLNDLPNGFMREADAIREEMFDACLQTDRSDHDEVGRIEATTDATGDRRARSSPREQVAAPIDLGNVDE